MQSDLIRSIGAFNTLCPEYAHCSTGKPAISNSQLSPYLKIAIQIFIGISYQILSYAIPLAYDAFNSFRKRRFTKKDDSKSLDQRIRDSVRRLSIPQNQASEQVPEGAKIPEQVQAQVQAQDPVLSMEERALLSDNAELRRDDVELRNYGLKHFNLIQMARLAQDSNIPGIVIPIPRGVKSEDMENFLKKYSPEVFARWAQIGKMYDNCEEKTSFLNNADVVSALKSINEAIKKVFDSVADDKARFQELLSNEFLEWIQSVKSNKDYIIVRSTGAEDSSQVANAGGNESKPYVFPDQVPVSLAIGEVVCSYFSCHSLQNRINGKSNPFTEKLEIAVTAQQVIGEEIGGASDPEEIPISLVLVSNELLYVGHENFRLMRISATYGFGASVVGNVGIGCDTILILQSEVDRGELYILYDNQPKPERLAPVLAADGVQLGRIGNPESMKNRRALDDELLKRLYGWGVAGEVFFKDTSTDMEIVIKGKKGGIPTIYPVQARPANRPKLIPTYLDAKKVAKKIEECLQNPITQKIQAEMLVPGQSSVVIAESSREILFAPTLKDADEAYREGCGYKIVVVLKQDKPEPGNSHPIVNFSCLGIPCLAVSDEEEFSLLLQMINSENPLVIDVQTAVINHWNATLTDVNECTSNGFVTHPARIAVSLPVSTNFPLPQNSPPIPQDVMDLILAARNAITQRVAHDKLQEVREAQNRLGELQNHVWMRNVKRRKADLDHQLHNAEDAPSQIKEPYHLIVSLDATIDRAFEEAMSALAKGEIDEQLHPLFHLKVIENLIRNPYGSRSISQITIADVDPLCDHIQALMDYEKSLGYRPSFSEIVMIGKHSIMPETEGEWVDFLRKLEPFVHFGEISQAQALKFKQMIDVMDKAKVLPTWFAFFFHGVAQSEMPTIGKFEALLESLLEEEIPLINYLSALHLRLVEGQINIDLCGQSQGFEHGWKWLQDIVKTGGSGALLANGNAFGTQVRECSSISKMIAVKIMQQLVDTFDLSIKAMKANQALPPEEKVKLFKIMLKPYLALLLDWGTNIVDPAMIPMCADELKAYLVQMEKIYHQLPADNVRQLRPSRGFSVIAAMIGSETNISRHLPGRLEDLFTLIHQDLLACLASLNRVLYSQRMMGQAQFPLKLKAILDKLDLKRYTKLSVDITEEEIVVKYNIPLNNHSAQILIRYDKQSDRVTFKGFLLGRAGKRWQACDLLIAVLDQMGQLKLCEPTYVGWDEINFCWELKDLEDLSKVMDEWDQLLKITYLDGITPAHALFDFRKRKNIDEASILQILVQIAKNGNVRSILGDRDIVQRLLLEKNDEINAILIETATKGMSYPDEDIHDGSLEIFAELAESGMGHKAAAKAAIIGIMDHDLMILWGTIGLCEVLLSHGYSGPELAEVARIGIRKEYCFSHSLELFINLFKQKQGYEAAIEVVLQGLQDEKPEIRSTIRKLSNELVKAGYGEKIQEQAVKKGIDLIDLRTYLSKNSVMEQLLSRNVK